MRGTQLFFPGSDRTPPPALSASTVVSCPSPSPHPGLFKPHLVPAHTLLLDRLLTPSPSTYPFSTSAFAHRCLSNQSSRGVVSEMCLIPGRRIIRNGRNSAGLAVAARFALFTMRQFRFNQGSLETKRLCVVAPSQDETSRALVTEEVCWLFFVGPFFLRGRCRVEPPGGEREERCGN